MQLCQCFTASTIASINTQTEVLYLDFVKGLESVKNKSLIIKLKVQCDESSTWHTPFTSGIPQEKHSGARTFIIFINDLQNFIPGETQTVFYVGENKLNKFVASVSDCRQLQQALKALKLHFCSENHPMGHACACSNQQVKYYMGVKLCQHINFYWKATTFQSEVLQ